MASWPSKLCNDAQDLVVSPLASFSLFVLLSSIVTKFYHPFLHSCVQGRFSWVYQPHVRNIPGLHAAVARQDTRAYYLQGREGSGAAGGHIGVSAS